MNELEQARPCAAVEYSHTKPALLFGSHPRRRGRAESALAGAGVRLVDSISLDEGEERLAGQVSLGLAWLELAEEDANPKLDSLLIRLNELAEMRGTVVIASAPLELVDLVAARLTDRATEILIDPDEAERAATLATALSGALDETSVSDVARTMPRACASCRTKWAGLPRRWRGCRPGRRARRSSRASPRPLRLTSMSRRFVP